MTGRLQRSFVVFRVGKYLIFIFKLFFDFYHRIFDVFPNESLTILVFSFAIFWIQGCADRLAAGFVSTFLLISIFPQFENRNSITFDI